MCLCAIVSFTLFALCSTTSCKTGGGSSGAQTHLKSIRPPLDAVELSRVQPEPDLILGEFTPLTEKMFKHVLSRSAPLSEIKRIRRIHLGVEICFCFVPRSPERERAAHEPELVIIIRARTTRRETLQQQRTSWMVLITHEWLIRNILEKQDNQSDVTGLDLYWFYCSVKNLICDTVSLERGGIQH